MYYSLEFYSAHMCLNVDVYFFFCLLSESGKVKGALKNELPYV